MDPVKWFLTGAYQNHIFKANSFSNLTMHGGWTLGLSDFLVTHFCLLQPIFGRK